MPRGGLGPKATLQQAGAYVKTYHKKVESKMRGSLSTSRGPMYSLHKSTLDIVRGVQDPQVKVYLCMSVIESICSGGTMASFDFPCKDVFTMLRESLLLVAQQVQLGACNKESTRVWVTDQCLGPIQSGTWSYVTGEAMRNFAAEDLGDWGSLARDFEQALDTVLSADALAALVESRAQEQVAAAEAVLEDRKAEVEKARKQLAAAEKKQITAENKVKAAKKGLEQARKKRSVPSSGVAEPNAAKKSKS